MRRGLRMDGHEKGAVGRPDLHGVGGGRLGLT